MSSIAFGLRADYQGTVLQRENEDDPGVEVPIFQGGVVNVGDSDFNVGEAIEAGGGVIVVHESNGALVDRLATFPALMRVPVPEDADVVDQYATMTVAALRDEARRRDLAGYGNARKDALVAALREHDAAVDAGDQVAVDELDVRAAGDADANPED